MRGGPVDLNSATAEQLDTLPGVGPATAAAILTYRTRHGRFKTVTELLEVPGIGPSKLEALRPLVTVRMSDLTAVVLALATAGGAWAARPLPLLPVLAVAAVGVGLRRPAVVVIGAALAASALGARAEAGLRPPVVGRWQGTATLVGDPADVPGLGVVRVDVRIRGKRVEAQARGRAAARLRGRLAGEQVSLSGEVEEVPASASAYLSRRHVAARMTVAEVGRWSPGAAPSRLANGLRRTLVSGAESMTPERRALYAGFVLGDDRGQPVEITDDFRAAGLSHLLVVSGQNVAFVLALLSPLLRRLRLGWRLVAGLVLLLLFGVLTRWEPSVLRAEAMAALALVAATLGRQASGLRILALAATGLLLVDPLLVGSIGFLLSVGASAGILLLAGPIARLIPGPRPLAQALAVTVAAQVGVAPILVPVFDGLPVAALPANLLAVPVAGPLMMWGLAAGLPAGLIGGLFARIVHLPTEALVAWVAAVARWGAAAPLGRLRLPHLVAPGRAGAGDRVGSTAGRPGHVPRPGGGGRRRAAGAGRRCPVACAARRCRARRPAPRCGGEAGRR